MAKRDGFIRIDDSQIRELSGLLSGVLPKELDRARRIALSRTRRGAQQRVSTLIRTRGKTQYNLPARRAKLGIRVTPIRNDAFFVIGNENPISLTSFSGTLQKFSGKFSTGRKRGAGVQVQIIKGQRRRLRSAFIARGVGGKERGSASGADQVFSRFSPRGLHMGRRLMKRGTYAGKTREVIRAVKGPSIASMMRRNEAQEDLADFVQERFDSELARAIRFALNKRRK